MEIEKRELRRRLRAARQGLGPGVRAAASARVRNRVAALPEVAGDGPVVAYAAAEAEVDLDPWLSALLAAGRPVWLPRVAGEDLEVAPVHTLADDLMAGFRGLREPRAPAVPAEAAAVVVVPGVGFDVAGGRLGQGGGHVDRLLARLDRSRTAVVGVAFDVQVVAAVPREAHDRPVDVVVTESRVLRAG